MAPGTAWEAGRFDAAPRPAARALRPHVRGLRRSSARRSSPADGCSASRRPAARRCSLAPDHEVVAVDINPAQLAYAAQRIAGAPMVRGTAEHVMHVGRALLPLAGWRRRRCERSSISTIRRRSTTSGRRTSTRGASAPDWIRCCRSRRCVRSYAPRLLASLPHRFGAVMRARMERCFGRHPNRTNPWVRALLAGELTSESPPPEARTIKLVQSDAAAFLEQARRGSFDGFTLSNILDGADDSYRRRLADAVSRAAAPGAVVVLRSFGEPAATCRRTVRPTIARCCGGSSTCGRRRSSPQNG